MKSKFVVSLVITAFSLAACATSSVAEPTKIAAASQTVGESVAALKAFPAAKAGQTRHIIHLPQQTDESDLKIELMVGKMMPVDCNNHLFRNGLDEKTAEGWGYTYYVVEDLGPMMSTLKGCPANSSEQRFIKSSDQKLVRYNSRLPLVIYTLGDVEVHYRLWRAEAEQIAK